MSNIVLTTKQTRLAMGIWPVVGGLGVAHMLVDATSIYTACKVAAGTGTYTQALWVIAVYNLLAFAPQALLGWVVDRAKSPLLAASLGAGLAAVSAMLWPYQPALALWLACMGNGLFHVGGGSVCLQLSAGRAAPGGVFVGPGSFGVVIGMFTGMGWWAGGGMVIAACAAAVIWLSTVRVEPGQTSQIRAARWTWLSGGLVIALLMLAVIARQFVGGAIGGGWWLAGVPMLWLVLNVADMLGKMVMGFVADHFGWMLVAVPLALLATPLVWYARGRFGVSFTAVFVAQAAMPVTLAALWRVIPRYPGLTFGILSSCFWLGGLPGGYGWLHASQKPLLAVQLIAAAAIAGALLLLGRAGKNPTAHPDATAAV